MIHAKKKYCCVSAKKRLAKVKKSRRDSLNRWKRSLKKFREKRKPESGGRGRENLS